MLKRLNWHFVPRPDAYVIWFDIPMNVASLVQATKRLDQLAQHVEHYTRLLVVAEVLKRTTVHETLNRITTRLHFNFSDFFGVGES